MTLEDFESLDYFGRMKAALKSVCIGGREENMFKVLLYQLDGFYIEVYYHAKYHYISEFMAFDAIDRLDPYLDKISLYWPEK